MMLNFSRPSIFARVVSGLLSSICCFGAWAPSEGEEPSPASSVTSALAAKTDLWGEAAMRQPDGPSYEYFAALLPREAYCGDIPTPVYSLNSNANCWRGLRDWAWILDELGETERAKQLSAPTPAIRSISAGGAGSSWCDSTLRSQNNSGNANCRESPPIERPIEGISGD